MAALTPLIVTAEADDGPPVEALPVFIATAPDVVPKVAVPGVHREEGVLQGEPEYGPVAVLFLVVLGVLQEEIPEASFWL